MKIVINSCFGCFGLSDEARAVVTSKNARTDANLIRFIEEHGSRAASTDDSWPVIVDIPDDATDYIIDEIYDGYESIIYVLNRKLYRLQYRKREDLPTTSSIKTYYQEGDDKNENCY